MYMNKYHLLSTITLCGVVFAGCTSATVPDPNLKPTEAPVQQSNSSTDKNTRLMMAAAEGKGSATCEISKDDGTEKMTFMMKGTKNKAMGASLSGGKGMGYMINDGNFAYIWSDQEKTGTKIDLKKAVATASNAPQYEDFSKEEVQKDYEEKGYTYNCSEANIADSEFVPPKNVEFVDMSQMMEQSTKMMQDVQGGKEPSEAEMKKYEEMMKQNEQ